MSVSTAVCFVGPGLQIAVNKLVCLLARSALPAADPGKACQKHLKSSISTPVGETDFVNFTAELHSRGGRTTVEPYRVC